MKKKALSLLMGACLMLTGSPIVHAAETSSVRIARLDIKPGCLEAFLSAVREEMATSLRVEPGVLALYAVADRQDPTKLTFFEMYVDDAAYERHRRTPHFQKYYQTTKDMIARRVLLEAIPVELRDRRASDATPPER